VASLSDQIEKYFRKLLNKAEGEIEIKRNKLADEFSCAPSQINYVLDTRFTVEKGYLVESQRGGGGFIRIIRIGIDSETETLKNIISRLDDGVTQNEAEGVIDRLYDNNLINNCQNYPQRNICSRGQSHNTPGRETFPKNSHSKYCSLAENFPDTA